jgi:hypothetical protein
VQVTVVNVTVTPKGADPTGALSHGEITLKGTCLTGNPVLRETTELRTALNDDSSDRDSNDVCVETPRYAAFLLEQTDEQAPRVQWDVAWVRIQKRKKSARVIAMKIGEDDGIHIGYRYETALVLQAVQPEERVYERLSIIVFDVELHPGSKLSYSTAAQEMELTIA